MNIGNGENTFLWHDNWHPKGPLKDKYESRILYDTNINNQANKETHGNDLLLSQ